MKRPTNAWKDPYEGAPPPQQQQHAPPPPPQHAPPPPPRPQQQQQLKEADAGPAAAGTAYLRPYETHALTYEAHALKEAGAGPAALSLQAVEEQLFKVKKKK